MNNREILENFKNAVASIWSRDGQNTWPIEINSILHLFMDIFVEELFKEIHCLQEQDYEDKQIAAGFQTSSRILRLIMPCVLGMKFSRYTVDNIREKVLYLLNLAKYLKYGDLSNQGGGNTVYAPDEFTTHVDKDKMEPADKKNSLLIHKLCAILWNYAESVCFKLHGLIRQFHGPYRWPGNGKEILLRDFIHLNPTELWEETRIIPYEKVRIVTAYEGLSLTVDIYDNITGKEGSSYINSLHSYYVEADGKILNPEQIQHLCNVLSEVMISITGKVETRNWRQLTKKYAEIFWYNKKELAKETSKDWYYPPIVDQRIENGEISTRLQNLEPQALQRMLRISF